MGRRHVKHALIGFMLTTSHSGKIDILALVMSVEIHAQRTPRNSKGGFVRFSPGASAPPPRPDRLDLSSLICLDFFCLANRLA